MPQPVCRGTRAGRARIARALAGCAAALVLMPAALAQEITVPHRVAAGAGVSIQTSGSGAATLYLVGPGTAIKRGIRLGTPAEVSGADLRNAGRYKVMVRAGGEAHTANFFVVPGAAQSISFLARPSRVPVAARDAISGVAFVFDNFQNLTTAPASVTFNLAIADGPSITRKTESHEGIAWTRLDSARKAGAAQFVASVPGVEVRRVVQQVASDPCELRFHIKPGKSGIEAETDPIRDCSGNAVPDGTIVTFTENDGRTRSTVDARIKRGVAQAQLPAAPGATITVASGVVAGNEVRVGGEP
ncbi:MAG: hypothetical protein JO041_14365 [Acidobacteria bacterium]|nr:hypothetical protein [Acidobacteriota bacterium]